MFLQEKHFTGNQTEIQLVKYSFLIRSNYSSDFYKISDEKLIAVSVSGVSIFTIDKNNKKVCLISS